MLPAMTSTVARSTAADGLLRLTRKSVERMVRSRILALNGGKPTLVVRHEAEMPWFDTSVPVTVNGAILLEPEIEAEADRLILRLPVHAGAVEIAGLRASFTDWVLQADIPLSFLSFEMRDTGDGRVHAVLAAGGARRPAVSAVPAGVGGSGEQGGAAALYGAALAGTLARDILAALAGRPFHTAVIDPAWLDPSLAAALPLLPRRMPLRIERDPASPDRWSVVAAIPAGVTKLSARWVPPRRPATATPGRSLSERPAPHA